MFSLTLPHLTRAPLRNSVKILGAAAIVLLAAGNTLANATESPARIAQEQHARVIVGIDPWGRRYDACIRSLERIWSPWNFARAVSADAALVRGPDSSSVGPLSQSDSSSTIPVNAVGYEVSGPIR